MKNKHTIAFIGGGNMASALISGLIAKKQDPTKIIVSSPNIENLKNLQQNFGIQIAENNITAIKDADIIILAVKPQKLAGVAKEIKNHIGAHQILVSIAVGISLETLAQWFEKKEKLVRGMPNLPAAIGAGITGLYANDSLSSSDREKIQALFSYVGTTLWVAQEDLLAAITAISGSGPALVFFLLEAFQGAGITLGFSENDAKLLALNTFFGSSKMALESDLDVETLRKQVTSPQGTTERAISVFEEKELKHIIMHAFKAAIKRAEELRK